MWPRKPWRVFTGRFRPTGPLWEQAPGKGWKVTLTPIQPEPPADTPAPPQAALTPETTLMSDATKFIVDPLENTLKPVAIPLLQDFTTGLTQLLDALLTKAGNIGDLAAPEVNLTLALASAYGSNLLSTKLGTATTPAQLPGS